MNGKTKGAGIQPLHIVAAILLLLSAILQFERGAASSLFFVSGFSALLISFSTSSFFSRPAVQALALWFEAVCLLMAAFIFFRIGKIILPWTFLFFACFYAWKGLDASGLKK